MICLRSCKQLSVWDGESAIGRWRTERVELTQCQAFRGALAA
jgi:hypothetical protein